MLRIILHVFFIGLLCIQLNAQNQISGPDVPHITTFPAVSNSHFQYISSDKLDIPTIKLEKLSTEIKSWIKSQAFVGGELLILKKGNVIFHESYGWSDIEKKIPLERNSIWCIKSMTKPYIATAIMILIEEGKISLDNKIIDFLPEFAGNKGTTIANLLAHTSGYSDSGLGDTSGYNNLKSWVNDLVKNKPEREFGNYAYSDSNYAILTYLIEHVTKTPADKFIYERIFSPLKLIETYTHFSPDSSWSNKANSRYRWADGHYIKNWTNLSEPEWSFFPGAWGVWSTATDYAKFLQTILQNGTFNNTKILKPNTVKEMISPHGFNGDVPVYGYGWTVRLDVNQNSLLRFGHGGIDGTAAYVFPEEELIILFMTHGRNGDHLDSFKDLLINSGLTKGMISPAMIPKNKFPKPLISLKENDFKKYIGKYLVKENRRNPIDLIASIYTEDNRLKIKINPIEHHAGMIRDLIYLGNNRFALGLFYNDKLEWVNPHLEIELPKIDSTVQKIKIFAGKNIVISGQKEDIEKINNLILSTRQLKYIDELIDASLQERNIKETKLLSTRLHEKKPSDVKFSEQWINFLGYRYLREKLFDEAIAVFEMNNEAYPDSPNSYDSLADAWSQLGNYDKAKSYYEKALNIARKLNDPMTDGIEKRLKSLKNQMLNKN